MKSAFVKNSNSELFFPMYLRPHTADRDYVGNGFAYLLVSLAGITSLETGQAWVPRLDCCGVQHPRRMW